MESILSFATRLAEQAGEILLEQFRRVDKHPQVKPDFSLVTDADLQADRWLSAEIRREYPQDSLLSEELNPIYSGDGKGAVWVIDPLDGTTNFSLGLAYWGTSIARIENGFPSLAVMHFPIMRETYTAQRSGGAHFNDNALRVSPPDPTDKSTFFICCSRTYRDYNVGIRYKTRILGSAVYSFCAVARSMALIAFEARPKIWDLAAAWLLLQEAGGYLAAYDKAKPFPLVPGTDYSLVNYPTLAAASQALLDKGIAQIQLKQAS